MSNFIEPMEALLADELPLGDGWQYEPKWDGFRCIAIRERGEVALWSKSGKPLARYFPEIEAMFGRLKAQRFVIDGELLIATEDGIAFDALQLRLHPAASRIAKLAAATPAVFMASSIVRHSFSRSSGSGIGKVIRNDSRRRNASSIAVSRLVVRIVIPENASIRWSR